MHGVAPPDPQSLRVRPPVLEGDLVQRAGRIDRIGTEFDLLHLHSFFPEPDLEDLLRLVATLQSKIEAIDDQGLHDASVLGETPHPRAFNEVKRIEAEDASILDEEERSLELASSEGLRLQLQQAMQQGYDQQMEELPDGIHSVRTVRGDRGIFFCFEAHPDSPEQTTIRTLIGQRAIQAGVSRERVLSVLQFLNEPMARFAQRHLRQSYQAFTGTDDIIWHWLTS